VSSQGAARRRRLPDLFRGCLSWGWVGWGGRGGGPAPRRNEVFTLGSTPFSLSQSFARLFSPPLHCPIFPRAGWQAGDAAAAEGDAEFGGVMRRRSKKSGGGGDDEEEEEEEDGEGAGQGRLSYEEAVQKGKKGKKKLKKVGGRRREGGNRARLHVTCPRSPCPGIPFFVPLPDPLFRLLLTLSMQLVDAYFGDQDENEQFLREYILNQVMRRGAREERDGKVKESMGAMPYQRLATTCTFYVWQSLSLLLSLSLSVSS
jgi:hypothetical protein